MLHLLWPRHTVPTAISTLVTLIHFFCITLHHSVATVPCSLQRVARRHRHSHAGGSALGRTYPKHAHCSTFGSQPFHLFLHLFPHPRSEVETPMLHGGKDQKGELQCLLRSYFYTFLYISTKILFDLVLHSISPLNASP